MASCLRTMVLYMVERKYANGLKHATQALNASTNATSQRKHKTQALMGATRLASGIVQLLFSGACVFSFYFSDARRVAPIRGSVGW